MAVRFRIEAFLETRAILDNRHLLGSFQTKRTTKTMAKPRLQHLP